MPVGTIPDVSLAEVDFVYAALASGIREDGRAIDDFRQPSFRFGSSWGNVEVTLGETKVLAAVSSSVVTPRDGRPYEGFLNIQCELGAMAGAQYDPNTRSSLEEEARFERVLDKTLRRSDVVDKEALCLVAGKQVFAINLAIHFLNGAGSLISAAVLAGIVALRHYRRPDFTVIGSDVTIHSPSERVPIPLAMHHLPFSLEYALFRLRSAKAATSGATKGSAAMGEGRVVAVPDPSLLEDRLAEGVFIAILNAHREVCVLEKGGGAPIDADMVLALLSRAAVRVEKLHEQVEIALKDDLKTRSLALGAF
ncbi:ribosomal protein S5 domain 2-like protein [Tilletiaria anomala UBC 951]|uniref:Ribosomal protein S5 domain 2-like protein n=1 Tax=Tilletiaria anomala (strain ATCC 24038 / CBS 436.72 / UBC 951) TaxID=1037660 RepID=A0A066W8N0_TILAU|nr:ribosomal protein S5 domain 2-like protein [Tilletiaria anomala UBC 951]KDN47145.1 ribosomal protein S5 domain 2-like protein [Tilletiaria anomala UBC 951]